MTAFRLLADDLTGALDSAARFVGRFGPVPVGWRDESALPVLALDGAARECDEAEAVRRVAALAPALAGAELAFLKLDSLLRGHAAASVAACVAMGFASVAIAPAFPAQGRVTRHGRQLAHGVDVGVDLATALATRGISLAACRPGDAMPAGVSLWDAESDADLDTIAAAAGARVLWCGTGGLAGALGGRVPRPLAALPAPVLALIGSDHPVSAEQRLACRARLTLRGSDAAALPGHGAAVDVALPEGTPRAEAAAHISAAFAALLTRLDRPGTLIVTGGETLRGVCAALGATGLLVDGELSPGVPVSRLLGGRWPGLRIVSKSGAFGDAGLLARLLEEPS